MRDSLELGTLTPLHWIAIVAAVVTGLIHLLLGILIFPGSFGIAFILASIGFGIGILAVLINYHRKMIYLLGIPFTGGQIVLWYVFNQPIPPVSAPEVVDKLTQLILILALILLYRRER